MRRVLLYHVTLQWRHNDHDGVSNHQPHGCLLNRLFRRRSKKTTKLRVTGLCVGNSPGPVNSPHKWPVTRKMFPFDDVIMSISMHTGNICEVTQDTVKQCIVSYLVFDHQDGVDEIVSLSPTFVIHSFRKDWLIKCDTVCIMYKCDVSTTLFVILLIRTLGKSL